MNLDYFGCGESEARWGNIGYGSGICDYYGGDGLGQGDFAGSGYNSYNGSGTGDGLTRQPDKEDTSGDIEVTLCL